MIFNDELKHGRKQALWLVQRSDGAVSIVQTRLPPNMASRHSFDLNGEAMNRQLAELRASAR